MWFRKFVLLALSLSLCGKALIVSASQSTPQPLTIEQQIRRIGTGNDALVELTLRDGRKLKGYVIEIRADEFVIADAKNGQTMNVAYAQINQLKQRKQRRLSNGARTAIGVGIAAGIVTVAVVGYVIGQRPKHSGKTTFP